MIKNYIITSIFCVGFLSLAAQEVITFGNYDGTTMNITATSTVNEEITIVFEDVDIINNFYTENRTIIYMYGGLTTSAGTFQGSPGFNDLSSQPVLSLTDGDAATGPNTYSITINLAAHYSNVPDGTEVLGFNLLFQNEFGGGGNNQTIDLTIDLVDAVKDSSLSVNSSELDTIKTIVKDKRLQLFGAVTPLEISIYNIWGQTVMHKDFNDFESIDLDLSSQSTGIYIVKLKNKNQSKTVKVILD
ncbi:T9SS type A sorting domain-containing protein [Winogradskyella ursingii]|uniref:T9SS type A sorting domain-containing protein n=1 Tax=Winogradskyella ursingii TaxID=2686079 RepID=UPI0015CD51FE|nr:T9SS type A sorting domain-containing protein [Winogradskyella ursingii]